MRNDNDRKSLCQELVLIGVLFIAIIVIAVFAGCCAAPSVPEPLLIGVESIQPPDEAVGIEVLPDGSARLTAAKK